MTIAALDAELIAAHAAGDAVRLVHGYRDAAERAEQAGDIDRACFFYTQGWIFALDAGDPLADELRARLVAHGRERMK